MKTVVKDILSKIGKGSIFDSHLIIDTIIKNHHDEYLAFVAKNPAKKTASIHGKIAKIISLYNKTLVLYLNSKSISYNVKGNITACALWVKL